MRIPVTIMVNPLPQPTFTGRGAVPTPVPQAVPQQIPMAIPSKQPQGTPYLVPSLQPQAIPQAVPQPTPQRVPQAIPQAKPQLAPVMMPRPKPRPSAKKPVATGGTTTHAQTPTLPALAKKHVTVDPGRQAQHDLPQFDADDGGQPWRCVASGHGQRRTLNDRRVSVSGALRHIGSIDVLGRDLPALHPQHADCIISLRRKKN